MSVSSTVAPPPSLVHRSKILRDLLRRASEPCPASSSRIRETHDSICRQMVSMIEEMVQELKAHYSLVPESRNYVLQELNNTLEGLSHLHPSNAPTYLKLAQKLHSFQSQLHQPLPVISLPSFRHPYNLVSESNDNDNGVPQSSSSFSSDNLETNLSFEDMYEDLTDAQKRCLLSLSLFPDGAEIKRRDLINWWVGSNFIQGGEEEEILDKLVENKFIVPISQYCCISTSSSTGGRNNAAYRMCKGVHSKLQLKVNAEQQRQRIPLPDKIYVVRKGNIVDGVAGGETVPALLSINDTALGDTIFSMLSTMKKSKVSHLPATWRHDSGYVVLEDIQDLDRLLAFKNLGRVCLLSLRRTCGVVRLPTLVYRFKSLKVLDLRACHNLEVLSDGIESLENLTHLDLSECYLLDYIPKRIGRLSELRVLKGFIINPTTPTSKRKTSCAFGELLKLQKLSKLSIRTRRADFPTPEDIDTLCNMTQLNTLKIEWVGIIGIGTGTSSTNVDYDNHDHSRSTLKELKKLELQAAPNAKASQFLEIISQIDSLKKLYIKGGELKQIQVPRPFPQVEQVRLQYLRELDMSWIEFKSLFPKLNRLEMFRCPKLIDFPFDDNGVWESPADQAATPLPPWLPLDLSFQ